MKKMLVVMLAVMCSFALSIPAWAGALAPPKELCLSFSTGLTLCLSTKASGTIKFADNAKVKYYTIDGSFFKDGSHFPVGGTGYMDGSLFRFHVSGQVIDGHWMHQSVNGYVDLSERPAEGAMTAIYSLADDTVIETPHELDEVPCSTIQKPNNPVL
ncbi:MAG: hypothetical protein FJ119_14735 [Deltaproteobacteria bacterium]|nr:hypothetical protein [Deltaproteobacteria bacterium]